MKVAFVEFANNVHIELIEATSKESTIAKFIEKKGEGMHHICLSTPEIKSDIGKLKAAGHRLVHETPFEGAKNCWVAFVHPSAASGVLLELSEAKKGDTLD